MYIYMNCDLEMAGLCNSDIGLLDAICWMLLSELEIRDCLSSAPPPPPPPPTNRFWPTGWPCQSRLVPIPKCRAFCCLYFWYVPLCQYLYLCFVFYCPCVYSWSRTTSITLSKRNSSFCQIYLPLITKKHFIETMKQPPWRNVFWFIWQQRVWPVGFCGPKIKLNVHCRSFNHSSISRFISFHDRISLRSTTIVFQNQPDAKWEGGNKTTKIRRDEKYTRLFTFF